MIVSLLALLGVQSVEIETLPEPPPPAERVILPPGATPPSPIEPGNWVMNDDYPPPALRANESGAVRFVVSVDTTGAVRGCSVTGSSGSELLDSATCALMYDRAHFRPARAKGGKAIASSYSGKFTWVIPRDADADEADRDDPPMSIPVPAAPPPPAPRPREPLASWHLTARMMVRADGTVTSCTQEQSGVVPKEAARACDDIKGTSLWSRLPFLGPLAGQSGTVVVDVGVKVADAKDTVKPVDLAVANLLAMRHVDFDVSETGGIENCQSAASAPGMTSSSTTPTCTVDYGSFTPPTGADGKPRRAHATFGFTITGKLIPPPDPNAPTT